MLIENNGNAIGIIAPDVDGMRQLYYPGENLWKEFQVERSGDDILQICDYRFLKQRVEEANEYLTKQAMQRPEGKWLIIDELGKLELKGEGLYPGIVRVLKNYFHTDWNIRILIVIRDSLLNEAVEQFGLEAAEVINTAQLSNIR